MTRTDRTLQAIMIILVLISIQLGIIAYSINHQDNVEIICHESVECK